MSRVKKQQEVYACIQDLIASGTLHAVTLLKHPKYPWINYRLRAHSAQGSIRVSGAKNAALPILAALAVGRTGDDIKFPCMTYQ